VTYDQGVFKKGSSDMIDWQVKVQELKQTADELDLWAAKSEGRQRTVLGRIADELRQFAAQIHQELVPPDAQQPEEVPNWLAAIVEPSTGLDEEVTGEEGTAVGEDEWVEDEDVDGEWNATDAPLA
jgi:hypothetical protein